MLCNNIAKLADFGYATRCLDTKGQIILSTSFCGTMEYKVRIKSLIIVASFFKFVLLYKAPEAMLCRKAYNPLISDCFSLGVLLYVMVTHEFPFGSGNEIRTSEGLQMHYEDVVRKKWKPTGIIQNDLKLYHLLCQLLNPDVKERITARQALVQAWLLE